jgi:uncharacterized membrane protein YoaK (UPF0700 family)
MAVCGLEEGGFMNGSQFGQADTWLFWGLAFVGGYGDAASFVLTKTFTGHVTGNLVLAAIAVAAHDWRAALGRLSAIVTFLIGTGLSLLIVRPLRAWPSLRLLPFIMATEAILITTASLALASNMAHRVEMFVILVTLALGLQNGTLRRAGGTSVHTTYLTGTISGLISRETERYVTEVPQPSAAAVHPNMGLLGGIGIAFVLGAGTGAAMVLRFKALGILGAAVLLCAFIAREVRS